jgi:hypothetical protein
MRFLLRTSSTRRQPGGCGHDIREKLFRVAPRGGFLHRLRQARALEVEHLLRSGGQGGWCFHERSTPCRVGAIIFSDGPSGHHVESSHRGCGFGQVFTQIHNPVKGTMLPPPPPLQFSPHVESAALESAKIAHPHHSDLRVQLGQFAENAFP